MIQVSVWFYIADNITTEEEEKERRSGKREREGKEEDTLTSL